MDYYKNIIVDILSVLIFSVIIITLNMAVLRNSKAI